MRSVMLLLLGAHLAYAGTHSLRYFYTAVSGDIDFPEFTVVGLVDEGQFMYFDSNTKEAVPKTEWMKQNEGAGYWDSQTQGLIGTHQTFKNNIQVAKERFNQSTGLHVFQQMYGCSWDENTGDVDGFDDFGYDGESFLSLDLKNLRYISTGPEALITQVKWNNDKAYLERKKQYRTQICIDWIKKYLQYGKSTLERKVSPQVSMLQTDPSSPVVCHATGFYPSGVTISWQKNGQDHDEDVDLGEIVPNEDGTFQRMRSKLTMSLFPSASLLVLLLLSSCWLSSLLLGTLCIRRRKALNLSAPLMMALTAQLVLIIMHKDNGTPEKWER
ncbi:hypothetical protein QQF64_013092 [Cirrhinus molitorella]|uniref:Ig-like domain-containing protein n=1 Tax=Cirrhinus molitorella TaxID=172907 RepID=A0ABR3LSF2_9TELE